MNFLNAKIKHRQVLNTLSQRLSREDLEQMVYICEGVIPESTAEGINTGIYLFRELEHRTYLGPGSYEFLKELLINIGRNDLASTLPSTNNEKMMTSSVCKPTVCSTSGRRLVLLNISSELRKEDVKKMAFLCSSNTKEGLSLMEHLESEGKISNDNYDYLADCLSEIGRQDLLQLLPTCVVQEAVSDVISKLTANRIIIYWLLAMFTVFKMPSNSSSLAALLVVANHLHHTTAWPKDRRGSGT